MQRFSQNMKRLAILAVLAVSAVHAQSIWVNDGGTLREITGIFINDGGTLRDIQEVWINDGGTLRQVFSSGPTVELGNKIHLTFTDLEGVAISNVRLHSNGNYYESNINGDGTFGAADELWLESGSAGDVWVERSITSGTLTTDDIGGSRVSLASGSFTMGVTTVSSGTKTCSFTLSFYDAASGGNLLDTAAITTTADGTGL